MKKLIVLEIFVLGILPILIFKLFNFSPQNSDLVIFPYIALILLWSGWLIRKKQLSFRDLGIGPRSFEGLEISVIVTILLTGLILLLSDVLLIPEWLKDDNSLLFLLFHTFIQELIFRGYFLSRIKKLCPHKFLVALIGGIIFGLIHFILPDSFGVVIATTIAGTVWGVLFLKFHNLYYVWLSHFVVNIAINILLSV